MVVLIGFYGLTNPFCAKGYLYLYIYISSLTNDLDSTGVGGSIILVHSNELDSN